MENCDDDSWGFFVEIDRTSTRKSTTQEPKKIFRGQKFKLFIIHIIYKLFIRFYLKYI